VVKQVYRRVCDTVTRRDSQIGVNGKDATVRGVEEIGMGDSPVWSGRRDDWKGNMATGGRVKGRHVVEGKQGRTSSTIDPCATCASSGSASVSEPTRSCVTSEREARVPTGNKMEAKRVEAVIAGVK